MKHAIMVLGSGSNTKVLQKLIEHFDDKNIDFFIHWDKKFPLPSFTSKYSKIILIPRIRVYWGTSTLVHAEKMLLESVKNNNAHYEWIHLISSSDIPLMTKDYFFSFFKENKKRLYLGFDRDSTQNSFRLMYYYPIAHFNVRKYHYVIKIIKGINRFFHVNRLKNKSITLEKGSEWFSIRSTYIEKILKYPNYEIFDNSFLADETYLQTILAEYKPKVINEEVNCMAARYIDWNRGKPYVFKADDIPELRKVVNTKYAFARKVYDEKIITDIFQK